MSASQLRSTGLTLVTQLMKSMGMTAPTTIAGATDKQAVQFWELATEAGQLLMGDYKWQFLSREMTITTVPSQAEYDLPDDFDGFVADSGWNHTTRLPTLGSLEQFEWQMLKARLAAGTTFTMMFRIQNDQVVFYATPSEVQTIVMPYQSRGWVQDATDPLVFKDNLEVDNDIVLFDPLLFKLALKKVWYDAKQFDTTKVDAQYQKALNAMKATDSPGRTLSLAGQGDFPYLGVINIPNTGYGL